MLDAPPCNSSEACYVLSTPIALNNTNGLIYKQTNGFWMDSGGKYLSEHNTWWEYNTASFGTWNATINKYYTGSLGLVYTVSSAQTKCTNRGVGWTLPLITERSNGLGCVYSGICWASNSQRYWYTGALFTGTGVDGGYTSCVR